MMKNFPLTKKRQSGMDFLEVGEVGRILSSINSWNPYVFSGGACRKIPFGSRI